MFEDISSSTIDNTIPQDIYLQSITKFLDKFQNAIKQSDELSKLPKIQLATLIMEGDISTPDLKTVYEYREKSTEKQELFTIHKELLKKALKQEASSAVEHTGEVFLEKF